MEENTGIQFNSSMSEHDILEKEKGKKAEWLAPYHFKKGQSGNPSGRKAGKSLKEYAKEMLSTMTDDERQDFLHGLSKETIWKLAEGNPDNKNEIKGDLTINISPEEREKIKNVIRNGSTNN